MSRSLKCLARVCLFLVCIGAAKMSYAYQVFSFSVPRGDQSELDGYMLPPKDETSPIVIAIQGSSCENSLEWQFSLSDHFVDLGFGVIVLEKPGVFQKEVDLLKYRQGNCLESRLEDYLLCLENLSDIIPGWQGKFVFWGESEGGVLAAELASKCSETAAVLLIASGGGLTPKEEVKQMVQLRMEQHGAMKEEVDEYMDGFEKQMQAMLLDPDPYKDFFGNSYKWWSSLLKAPAAVSFLSGTSIPVFLMHGVHDDIIPVLSADLAAEQLSKYCYLRLEDYDHNLQDDSVYEAGARWIQAVILEEMPPMTYDIYLKTASRSPVIDSWQDDLAKYVFYRGGSAGAEASGGVDANGNRKYSGEVWVQKDIGKNGKVYATGECTSCKVPGAPTKHEIKGKAGICIDW